jgi:transcriptional antiterminator RfaH
MKQWHVVYTKSRQESVAECNLQRQSFETYLPWISQARRQRGRWKEIVEPMFPRYLFIRLDLTQDNFSPIRSSKGVVGLVRFGDEVPIVPDQLVDALKRSADPQSGLHKGSGRPLFKKGDTVTILEGPFAGLKGIFQAAKGDDRVILLLEMLGRLSLLTLSKECIGS